MSEAPGPDNAGTKTETPEAPGPQQPFRPPLPPTPPERGGRHALWFALSGMVALFLPIPGAQFIGLALLVTAVVVGVRARRRARRVLAPVPGAVAGIVIGSLGLGLCVAVLAMYAVVYRPLADYEKCRNSANTNTDVRACQDQYFPKLEHKLHLPAGTLERHRSMF